MAKSISVRFQDEEYDYVKNLAISKNVSHTQLVKDALRMYGSDNSVPDDSLKDIASEIVVKKEHIDGYSHPFLTYIEDTGIEVVDTDRKIRNLTELLNFVEKNVFINAES